MAQDLPGDKSFRGNSIRNVFEGRIPDLREHYGLFCSVAWCNCRKFYTAIPGALHTGKGGNSNRKFWMWLPHTHRPARSNRANRFVVLSFIGGVRNGRDFDDCL
jgi:hypothetical protein